MNTIECIKTRRSIREYNGQPVDRKLIEQAIEAAAFSPSWKNTQVTRYIVIDDAALKDRIADECCSSNHNGGIIKQAPVLVVTTMIKARSGYERDGSFSTPKGDGWQMFDCGIATQSFCLAAHELGLSTLIMGIYDTDKITEILQIPETQEVAALISVGYTDLTDVAAPKRKTLEDLITYK
jgi:nitroreductase